MPTALIRLLVDASATLSDKLDILLKMSSTSSLGKLERGNLGDPTRFGDLDPNLFGDLDLHPWIYIFSETWIYIFWVTCATLSFIVKK